MVKILRLISVISLTLISGCGTARVIIDEPPLRQYSSSTIYTESKSTTVGVPVKLLQHFDESLNKELAKSFSSGKGLLLEYRFLSFDEGNQVKRYLAGGVGDWGTGSLLLEATFKDSRGDFIGKIRTDGRISSGFVGGSMKSVLNQAAKELSEYAKMTFH